MLSPEQIQLIIDEMKQDARVAGILLTGSYVYGTPTENSDLDVRCVTNDGSDWGEIDRMRFNTRVEVFFNPPEKLRWYMQRDKDEGHGSTIHFWANGKIVHDPNGIATQLQSEARKMWLDGPGSSKEWVWQKPKHQKYIGKEWKFDDK